MKKLLFIVLIALMVLPLMADRTYTVAFTTAFNLAASGTATNGTEFTSAEVKVSEEKGTKTALLTMTFTRAAGSATLTVDYYFQVSFDGGTSWSDYIDPTSIITGHSVISGTTVAVSKPLHLFGVSHIRLSKVVNGDTANNLTACNAYLSW